MINQKPAVIAPVLADVVSKTMPATLAAQFHSSNNSLVSVANWGPVFSVDLWTMYGTPNSFTPPIPVDKC